MELSCREAILKRRSIRKFKPTPVDTDILEQLIEAARLAPSGTNRQPWRFVLLTGRAVTDKLSGAVMQSFVLKVPALFVCCVDLCSFTRHQVENRMQELVSASVISKDIAGYIDNRDLPDNPDDVQSYASAYLDLGIAVENMVLQATALGLGSCWIRLFNPLQVHEALGLPPEIKVVALLPVGYPAQDPPPRPRLSREEILIEPK